MELDVPALISGGRLSVLVARACQKRTRALAAAREQKETGKNQRLGLLRSGSTIAELLPMAADGWDGLCE